MWLYVSVEPINRNVITFDNPRNDSSIICSLLVDAVYQREKDKTHQILCLLIVGFSKLGLSQKMHRVKIESDDIDVK